MKKHTSYSRSSLFEQVQEDFLAKIASKEWPAGMEVKSESMLSSELGISLGTLRKAFDHLVYYGLVTRHQGKGTFVIDYTLDSYLSRFWSIFDLSHNPQMGEITISDCKVLQKKNTLGINPAMRDWNLCLNFKRKRTHNDREFLLEDVYLPLEDDGDSSKNRKNLESLALRRWVPGQVPLTHKEYVFSIIPEDIEHFNFDVERYDNYLRLNTFIYSHNDKLMEFSDSLFFSNGDLNYISK